MEKQLSARCNTLQSDLHELQDNPRIPLEFKQQATRHGTMRTQFNTMQRARSDHMHARGIRHATYSGSCAMPCHAMPCPAGGAAHSRDGGRDRPPRGGAGTVPPPLEEELARCKQGWGAGRVSGRVVPINAVLSSHGCVSMRCHCCSTLAAPHCCSTRPRMAATTIRGSRGAPCVWGLFGDLLLLQHAD